ncbi:phage regulatory protein/antirepressor Ant [Lysinibacillus sp. OL1_EC]|uniref:phage regulatory protein/antirepressor Ant n=1 Tax=unclassified Lysinibacillus TaxID=2636778 RepID=UPI001D0F789E|nr:MULTISPECIES: phage regulatory protein/antirepressor Ant [unclassified Lysinibacillus]MCM0625343.1 phage regulatory protein/antirepressor Ant [Lysinibacillus sp. OL1_EC]
MNLVIIQNRQAVTTSLQVAQDFEKGHNHVLRDIDALREGVQNWTDLFKEGVYKHPQNKQQYRMFYMNRDGFTLLAMGFNGSKALDFKLKYIQAFNEMERQLTQPQLPTNYKEALLALVKEVEKNEQLEIEKQMYQQQVADMQPIVTYVDEVLKCTDLLLTSQIAEDYGMSAYALNKLLNEHGIQYSLNKQWLLYSKFKGQGYTKSETKEYKKPDGSTGVRLHTKWTQKGRLFLYETLKAKGILPTMERMKLKLIEGNKQLA